MNKGDILKYMPTSTVGKVTEIREKDGKVWARLDVTDLYYDVSRLVPADASEYKDVSFKEQEAPVDDYKKKGLPVDLDAEMQSEVDIADFMPSGGG
ncbi:MAG: DUF2098 domain-containing protein [Euryarchaeota archaeon]|jgi:hypothetical protein|nr:DUF2098 domain-containing protein [Euryarchaeota archaeon]